MKEHPPELQSDSAIASGVLPRVGHSYSNVDIRDHGRVHLGDTHISNYFGANYMANHVPRPALQAQLIAKLHDRIEERESVSRIIAICGFGGVGKTQLVRDYITTYRADYTSTFWVDAGSPETLGRDFDRIHHCLYESTGLTGARETSVEMQVNDISNWCRRQEGRWMFVLDSADDVDAPGSSGYIDLQKFIPDADMVDVVITTRSQSVTEMTTIEAVQVAELTADEARELFCRRSKLKASVPEDQVEIDRIVKELGYLALVVNLAGSYVGASSPPARLEDYLVRYRWQRTELLKLLPKHHVDQYGASVIGTWEQTFTAISSQYLLATDLLAFLAFLSPDDMFYAMFVEDGATLSDDVTSKQSRHSRNSPGRAGRLPQIYFQGFLGRFLTWNFHGSGTKSETNPFRASVFPSNNEVDKAFRPLVLYSLVQKKDEQRSYVMHKLVHEWSYTRMEGSKQAAMCMVAWNFLQYFASHLEADPATKIRLGPHIMACFTKVQELCDNGDLKGADVLDTLIKLADFLSQSGQWTIEFNLRQFAYVQLQHRGGAQKKAFLDSLGPLGSVLQRQGKYAQAERLFRQAWDGRRKEMGDRHGDTLESMSNLAIALQDQAQYVESEKLLQRAFELYENSHGKDHPDTLSCMRNLASVLCDEAKYDVAETLLQEVLSRRKPGLSKTHVNLLATLIRLGVVLLDQGKSEEALELFQRTFEGYTKKLGPTHQCTLTSLNNIGSVLQDQGKFEEAEKIYRQVLAGRHELGTTHPDTLTSLNSLGSVLLSQGKCEEAETLFHQALDGYTAERTTNHPDALQCMMYLGQAFQDQGRYEAARQRYQEALKGCQKALGDFHPDTLAGVWRLAGLARAKESFEESIQLHERALKGFVDVLGCEHPTTIQCFDELQEGTRAQQQQQQQQQQQAIGGAMDDPSNPRR